MSSEVVSSVSPSPPPSVSSEIVIAQGQEGVGQRRDFLFKIIVIGDVCTGKTSLIHRYIRNIPKIAYKPTIGVDFSMKLMMVGNSLIRLQFWDISGQDRFATVTRVYFKDAHGVIVLSDCGRVDTLEGAFRWKHDVDLKLFLSDGKSIPSILCMNKCDTRNNITPEMIEEAVKKGKFHNGFKTSTLTGEGMNEALDCLVHKMIETQTAELYEVPIFLRDRFNLRILPSRQSDELDAGQRCCC